MSTENQSKINQLLSIAPSGVVLSSAWLVNQGYSLDLQKRYKKSKWFKSFGRGALIRNEDTVDYLGGIQALQNQLGLSVHPAAKTALILQGKSHYLEFSTQKVQLFSTSSETLPTWFKNYDWGVKVENNASSFLPPDIGIMEYQHKSFEIKVSSPVRAIMECLYLAPNEQPLLEVYELIEGLNNIRPVTAQKLLESCTSVKVKRLFLYMAEKAGHEWLTYINQDKIELGKGKRQIVSDGVYVSKYQITVPKELEKHI
ncbi:MAG: type IV toxin-antitoxin system AbiEi family antitoxin [Thalassotalea sp.]|nr:type IV toxin-antitoxin system AbiEi family antitoxin [Thalassotalea sp.]